MISERMYKMFIYSCSSLGTLFVLRQGNFLHKYILGDQDSVKYFTNYPCQKVPHLLDDVYLIKLSYHLYEMIYTLAYLRDRRDFPEYVLHHLLTLVLVIFSYSLNFLTIGSVIMFLTDVTDCIVSLFKITADVTKSHIEYSTFSLMLISWVYLRMWFYPVYIMKGLEEEGTASDHYV